MKTTKEDYKQLRRKANELYSKGYQTYQIAQMLDISEADVVKLLGKA